MSIENLINELKSGRGFDIVEVRKEIQREFDAAATGEQRGVVLAVFKAVMDQAERHLLARSDQGRLLEDLRKARAQDYKIFIVQECTVGLDSHGGGDISLDRLMEVTHREIEEGRMTEDHSLRKLAVERSALPHFSHSELVEKHAALKAAGGPVSIAPAPEAAADTAEIPSSRGMLGRLKRMFRI